MSFISGRYTATWNALAMGQTRDGIRTSHQILKRPITGDAAAQARQDAVYQGYNMEAGMTLIEYDAAAVATVMWPGAAKWSLNTIGVLDVGGTGLAKSLVLTRVAGTNAVPATLTLALTALKENFPVELLFAPDLREVPLQLVVYPNGSGIFAVET